MTNASPPITRIGNSAYPSARSQRGQAPASAASRVADAIATPSRTSFTVSATLTAWNRAAVPPASPSPATGGVRAVSIAGRPGGADAPAPPPPRASQPAPPPGAGETAPNGTPQNAPR